MATLLAAGNHNFTAASWGTADATALLVSAAANTGITSTYQLSSTFTPGAITVDGIAIWVNTRNATPSGTVSIALDVATVTVTGTETTIDIADIPADGNCWVFFKFAAPVLLVAATAYSVKIKTSVASGQLNCFSSATTNWSRLLRTTTTAAPGAADLLYVLGEKTGAGTGNTITVTMDNTAATIFGQVDVSAGGFLIYGVAAATAYTVRLAGNLNIRSGGEVNIGTTSARIPSDSSAELHWDNTTNVDFGIALTGNGILRTGGNHNANPWALLAADAAGGATSLTTNISTGWKNGDTIAIASTTRTAAESEAKALGADAIGTSLPTIAALANAHGGNVSTLVTAELANLTRNVKIHGESATLQAFITCAANTVVDLNDTEIYFMGSATGTKLGINISTTTGSFSAEYCSFHDFTVAGSRISADTSAGANIELRHCVGYVFTPASNTGGFDFATATATGAVTLEDVLCLRSTQMGFRLFGNNNVTDIRAAGCSDAGINLMQSTYSGAITGLLAHSCTNFGIEIDNNVNAQGSTISNCTLWRSGAGGLNFAGQVSNLNIDGLTAFGDGTRNINQGNLLHNVSILNGDIRAGTVLTCAVGYDNQGVSISNVSLVNTVFGGSGQTHATADIRIQSANIVASMWLLDNCTLNSATQFSGQQFLPATNPPVNMLRANFLGQTQAHKTWLGNGTWSYDTAFAPSSQTVSMRLTPSSATIKLQSSPFLKSVDSGLAATVSIEVRKSVGGDGAAYNGNQPRLIVRRNYGAGITADTVLDTSTVAGDGAFETLSGTTAAVSGNCALQFYVDCDGTTGFVNVGNFTAS